MTDRTAILITHRLSTILAADEILVLADGAILEQGSHSALLSENGLFRKLRESQRLDRAVPADYKSRCLDNVGEAIAR